MSRVILMVCLVFMSTFLSAQRKVVDRVMATVGGEIVLLSEVEEQHALMASQGKPVPEDSKCFILEQLLANKLMINQAKLDSIIIADSEVEVQLEARIEQILGYMGGSTEQFENYYGASVNEVREEFRQDLKDKLMMDRMRAQIMQDVSVTPSEVKEFFYQIPTDSLPYFNSEVELGEIVKLPVVNEQEKERVRTLMEDLRQQILDSVATFEDLALKYSEDGTRNFGGDLGWSTRGKFVPEFEAAAYKLSVNEISEPVETQFGYHLIQMKPVIQQEDFDLAVNYLDSIRNIILKDTLSFSIAVKRYSNDEQQSYNNDGRMVNPASGDTFFEVGDLNPDVFFAIDTMKIDEISSPFEFRGQTGEINYRIVQLQSRTSPHTANLQLDYSKIRQAAIDSKRNEFINNWVDEKISDTFLQIEASKAKTCPNLQTWVQDRTMIRP